MRQCQKSGIKNVGCQWYIVIKHLPITNAILHFRVWLSKESLTLSRLDCKWKGIYSCLLNTVGFLRVLRFPPTINAVDYSLQNMCWVVFWVELFFMRQPALYFHTLLCILSLNNRLHEVYRPSFPGNKIMIIISMRIEPLKICTW